MKGSVSTTSTTQESSHVRLVPPRSPHPPSRRTTFHCGTTKLGSGRSGSGMLGVLVAVCHVSAPSSTLRKSGRRLIREPNSHEFSKRGTFIWVILALLGICEAAPRTRGASIYRGTTKLGELSGFRLRDEGFTARASCVTATL